MLISALSFVENFLNSFLFVSFLYLWTKHKNLHSLIPIWIFSPNFWGVLLAVFWIFGDKLRRILFPAHSQLKLLEILKSLYPNLGPDCPMISTRRPLESLLLKLIFFYYFLFSLLRSCFHFYPDPVRFP